LLLKLDGTSHFSTNIIIVAHLWSIHKYVFAPLILLIHANNSISDGFLKLHFLDLINTLVFILKFFVIFEFGVFYNDNFHLVEKSITNFSLQFHFISNWWFFLSFFVKFQFLFASFVSPLKCSKIKISILSS
jgi:hypothetical protein